MLRVGLAGAACGGTRLRLGMPGARSTRGRGQGADGGQGVDERKGGDARREEPCRAARGGNCMTYCVGMQLDSGLVFLSDSRTNAGVDHISTFRKMTVFEHAGERLLVLLSAGNLAVTQ